MSRAVAEVAEVPVVGSKIPSARNITGARSALSGRWLLVLANLKLAVELMFISGGCMTRGDLKWRVNLELLTCHLSSKIWRQWFVRLRATARLARRRRVYCGAACRWGPMFAARHCCRRTAGLLPLAIRAAAGGGITWQPKWLALTTSCREILRQ
ncbi:hypothetical protein KRX52_00500 [Pseudomonas sp. MAP12]|uniref:Uncharacterized protein n=1 Tax=Geopseudomonas aromaticivorans TaxID=2849492 RepID=A0ABS6MR47_9GAMM|nr:hypothetical protein [Pseudomonas aromaticivorans]